MKKKILISIIMLLVLLTLLITVMIVNFSRKKVENTEKKTENVAEKIDNYDDAIMGDPDDIIIESSYASYGWGFRYYGVLISTDGTIYEFNISGIEQRNELMSLDIDSEYKKIIDSSSKKNKKVSNNDLKDIIEYSNNIDYSNYKEDGSRIMYDAGTDAIYVVINNQRNLIDSSGERYVKSNDKNAQKLLKILNKYI